MREQLSQISLLSFLDSFSEPAFILCANASPQATLSFIYGNLALQLLVLGGDETAVLNDSTFFNILCEENDLRWLSNPTRSPAGAPGGGSRTVRFRPAWLPRDHVPLALELIATPIGLPLTIPAVGSNGRSFVFIASSHKSSQQLLRTEPTTDAVAKQQSIVRKNISASDGSEIMWQRGTGQTTRSTTSQRSKRDIEAEKLPSRLLRTFPWEETPLGPQTDWPQSLKTMVRYIMEKPVPVHNKFTGANSYFVAHKLIL